MDKLVSDRAQVEIGKKTLSTLRAYSIDNWQSEPHHQLQNFLENRWETVKRYTNRTLNQTGVDALIGYLCLCGSTPSSITSQPLV